MKDRGLMRRMQKGDQAAMKEIAETYYDDIYRFCLYLTGRPEDSYDCTQETFLKLIRYGASYRERNLKGYLLTIARNLCMDCIQKKRESELLEELPDGKNDLEALENRMLLRQLLWKIPLEQREAVLLKAGEGLKFREIAELTGQKLSTVKTRYRLGIERMRKEMEGS